MQQQFATRNISIRDFEEWNERHELTLTPKFQRRDIWAPKAKSFLIDTIIQGKPIPKLYMRQDVDPKTRRVTREIVDGQQRLRTVFSFLKDGFKISKAHSYDYGGMSFSKLDQQTQSEILRYEFVVDLLQDAPDQQVYDIFARINTFGEKLTQQELRNAKYFGEFKSAVYYIANQFVVFFEAKNVFTSKRIMRMAEAEFVSELLLAAHEGIREGKASVITKAYVDYDDKFAGRKVLTKKILETMDTLAEMTEPDLPNLKFRATRLFYPLFCALFHFKFGLPKLQAPRVAIKPGQYPKIKVVLEEIDELIERIEEANKVHQPIDLSTEDRKFFDAYSEHWVHEDKRTVMTQYLCRHFAKVLKNER
jgi:uncharacterized protein DUF262